MSEEDGSKDEARITYNVLVYEVKQDLRVFSSRLVCDVKVLKRQQRRRHTEAKLLYIRAHSFMSLAFLIKVVPNIWEIASKSEIKTGGQGHYATANIQEWRRKRVAKTAKTDRNASMSLFPFCLRQLLNLA